MIPLPPVADEAVPEVRRVFRVPVEGDVWIAVQGPFPITETQWGQFVHVLGVMKLGLVKEQAR